MSEEFNIFEDEKAQEIVWNQIIQDFAETKMPIDTFCRIKDIGEADLREHLNIRIEEFKEKEFQDSLIFEKKDIVELNPEKEEKISENYQLEQFVTIRHLQMEIQIPLNAREEVYRCIIKAVNEL
ncbi:MAG: hypothetical protein MJ181_12560 [Treponema sp.]|nr:hypothetical protein [Treponema sp.]